MKYQFLEQILRNENNREILARFSDLNVPQGFLVAGCLFQTVWNIQHGQQPDAHIKDYDIFYFDADDLSWEAEDAVISRANRIFSDLDVRVEVRNQARVHLWFEKKFGVPYPRLTSVQDGIDRFLIAGTCVGIRPKDKNGFELYAPYGLDEIYTGILRANLINDAPELFQRKVASYQKRWPWLVVR